ncbi:MAG: hypothetical protein ABII82_20045 [Verrucomicrobiota bacterium]
MTLRQLSIFFALAAGLHAQPASVPPENVSVEFRLYAWQTDVASLRFGPNSVIEEVEASSRSVVHKYEGPSVLQFTLAKNKPVNGRPPAPAAVVNLPPGVKKLTLLTIAGGGNTYRMYVLPEDEAALPSKHARLYNLTTTTLRVNYNETDLVEIPSAQSALLSAKGRGIVAVVSRMHNGRWRPMFSGVIMPQAAGGPNVLLANGMDNSAVNMFSVPAWPSKPAPADPDTAP